MTIVEEILLGSLLGFAVGLTGVGGAALTIPALVFVLDFTTVTAIATTFPFTAIIKVFGFLQHNRQGTFHRPLSLALLAGSIPATVLGVLILSRLFDRFGDDLDIWLNFSIGALVIVGVVMLLLNVVSPYSDFTQQSDAISPPKWLTAWILGAIFGLIIGVTSVGAGSLMIAPLILIFRISGAKVIGTSIGVSLVLMIVGTLGYWRTGLIDFAPVLYLSIGGVPAVIIGSKLTNRLSHRKLLIIISMTALMAAASLIVKGFQLLPASE